MPMSKLTIASVVSNKKSRNRVGNRKTAVINESDTTWDTRSLKL